MGETDAAWRLMRIGSDCEVCGGGVESNVILRIPAKNVQGAGDRRLFKSTELLGCGCQFPPDA
jgi:hypothetical protein